MEGLPSIQERVTWCLNTVSIYYKVKIPNIVRKPSCWLREPNSSPMMLATITWKMSITTGSCILTVSLTTSKRLRVVSFPSTQNSDKLPVIIIGEFDGVAPNPCNIITQFPIVISLKESYQYQFCNAKIICTEFSANRDL